MFDFMYLKTTYSCLVELTQNNCQTNFDRTYHLPRSFMQQDKLIRKYIYCREVYKPVYDFDEILTR